MTRTRTAYTALLGVALCACNDPSQPDDEWEPPVDIRGTYELESVSGIDEFPIYLGQESYTTPGGPGVVDIWIESPDRAFLIGSTRFHLSLHTKEVHTGGYFDGRVDDGLGTGTYGEWNYSPPLLFFEADYLQGRFRIGDGVFTPDGLELEVTITTHEGSELATGQHVFKLRKVSSEVDGTIPDPSGSTLPAPRR